jgi:hypothetical protein
MGNVWRGVRAAERPIAQNESGWSWEYNSSYLNATVYLNEANGNLRLVIQDHYRSTGINKEDNITIKEDVSLGNVAKPALAKAISLLKKHSYSRSSASWGFSKRWESLDDNGKELPLGVIIAKYASRAPAALSNTDKIRLIQDRIKNLSPKDYDKVMRFLGIN